MIDANKTAKAIVYSLFAFSILAAGCQSSGYRAAQLPAEFRVSQSSPNKAIDLSRIASQGTSDSIIAPNDLLKVTVATGRHDEKNTPVEIRVADNGTINVPVIGQVPVAGMEAFAAGQNIANLAIQRGMYKHPLVTVSIESKAINRITVLGAVEKPGTYEIPRGSSDLVSALAEAGGLTEEASTAIEVVRQPGYALADNEPVQPSSSPEETSEIQLAGYQSTRRANSPRPMEPKTFKLDLAAGLPRQYSDYRLSDRDVVRVVPLEKQVIHVTGLVTSPGQFDLPPDQDLRLLDAVALAGGSSSPVADKVFVIRHAKNRAEPLVIEASLAKAKQNGLENLLLTAEDTVSVEQTPATTIVDAFSRFFRLSFGVASNTIF
ncbi:MAG: SLBB domain-containing protein [Planctomycetota bacterium]